MQQSRYGRTWNMRRFAGCQIRAIGLSACLTLCNAGLIQGQRIAPVGVTRSTISFVATESPVPALDDAGSHRGRVVGGIVGAVIGGAIGVYFARADERFNACPVSSQSSCTSHNNYIKNSAIGMLFGALMGVLIGGEF